jgi:hypothetical protein
MTFSAFSNTRININIAPEQNSEVIAAALVLKYVPEILCSDR